MNFYVSKQFWKNPANSFSFYSSCMLCKIKNNVLFLNDDLNDISCCCFFLTKIGKNSAQNKNY